MSKKQAKRKSGGGEGEIPKDYQTIIQICKKPIYPYPDSHIWFSELREAIKECYAGGISDQHHTEHLATLASIIKMLATEPTESAEEQEVCEIALFLAGHRSEGQLSTTLAVDRLEARTRVQDFLKRVIADATVPLD